MQKKLPVAHLARPISTHVVFLPRQWAAGGGRRVLRRGHARVRLPGRRLALARPGISSPRPPLSIPSTSSPPSLGSLRPPSAAIGARAEPELVIVLANLPSF